LPVAGYQVVVVGASAGRIEAGRGPWVVVIEPPGGNGSGMS
jgi:hypothetical protein